jgi:hypothetical protein
MKILLIFYEKVLKQTITVVIVVIYKFLDF